MAPRLAWSGQARGSRGEGAKRADRSHPDTTITSLHTVRWLITLAINLAGGIYGPEPIRAGFGLSSRGGVAAALSYHRQGTCPTIYAWVQGILKYGRLMRMYNQ